MTDPQSVPGVRQDLLVTDAVTGEPRRFTVSTGTVWFAPPPEISNPVGRFRVVASPGVDPLDPSAPIQLFLPDSLPYRKGAEGVVTSSGAPLGGVDQTGADARLLYPLEAELAADPRGGDYEWVGLAGARPGSAPRHDLHDLGYHSTRRHRRVIARL